jgi:hypothetical protein
MDARLASIFHPAMKGSHLAPAQNRAKTENQLAHDSEARALPLQRFDDLRLLTGQLGARSVRSSLARFRASTSPASAFGAASRERMKCG